MTDIPDPVLFERMLPRIRARFPQIESDSLRNPRVYLNSGAGSLMVDTAAKAMSEASLTLNPMPGSVFPGESATADFQERVRRIVADFLHAGSPREVSFHVSSTGALFNFAFALQGRLSSAQNIIVTDLDHMANVSPWESFWGELQGCAVRRARVTPGGKLDVDHLLSLVDGKTGLVAVTMASNGFGSIVPLKKLSAAVKRKSPSALICVDAVHHALHGPIDVGDLGCDALVFSGYKVFGPMLGVLWGKGEVLDSLRPYRVATNKAGCPGKFELGMLNNASLASLEAALEYILWLADELGRTPEAAGSRPRKFTVAMEAVALYERSLSELVLRGFRSLDPAKFRCFGIDDPARSAERDPTFAFEIAGLSPAEAKRLLWERHGIQIADGNHYSAAVVRHLGREALCRASFAHYDGRETVRLFLSAMEDMAGVRA